jgi:hypothetical protein
VRLGIPRGPLDRLAALDRTGVVGQRVVGAARRVPGVVVGERFVQRLEDAVLRELSRRLDEATGARRELPSGDAMDAGVASSPNGRSAEPATPAELMDTLLRRSIDQDPAAGERSLLEMLIGELVPDEARILAALSDGSAFPVLDIVARGGDGGRTILPNVSSVGRQAGVVLPDRVPVYLGHLGSLGLIERGPVDSRLGDEYQILLTEPAVISVREAGGSGLRRPRVVRGTVHISELGRSVWEATRG